ncbi:hypothetical protein [Sedimenticola sp.]|uniref:hypothetical protein n=1 Tax=Sedimenticola sp. TaxID=1940285 RepID=UPI003D148224
MLIDEILIDEFDSTDSALAFLKSYGTTLKRLCSTRTTLAVIPESPITFRLVKVVS